MRAACTIVFLSIAGVPSLHENLQRGLGPKWPALEIWIMKNIARHSLTTQLGRLMPRPALSALALLAALSAGACASSPATSDIQIHTAADSKANLVSYKSFAWYASDAMLHDRTGVWVPKDVDTQSEVEFLVDKGLRAHGLTVAQDKPDLYVALLIVADVQDVQELKSKRG